MSRTSEVAIFLLANVEAHPSDLVAVAMKHFGITRPAVHLHLNELIKAGEIEKRGSRRSTIYLLGKNSREFIRKSIGPTLVLKVNSELREQEIWDQHFERRMSHCPKNIQDICVYGFTEILNNVIDHSDASKVQLSIEEIDEKIRITIHDDGIGVFAKVSRALQLIDFRESVLHLTKGKFTTDPDNHSGEGLFFTSRSFDEFSISSTDIKYFRFNQEEDWFVESTKDKHIIGTRVEMEIKLNTKRTLGSIFEKYQDHETFEFDKTTISVKLAKLEGERFISRSQAKRVLLGLEKFNRIDLDFSDVRIVGQGFVDEVFRVYKAMNPGITINYLNANSDVEFMIKRGLAPSRK